jgi:hypothetical protein
MEMEYATGISMPIARHDASMVATRESAAGGGKGGREGGREGGMGLCSEGRRVHERRIKEGRPRIKRMHAPAISAPVATSKASFLPKVRTCPEKRDGSRNKGEVGREERRAGGKGPV